MKEKKEPLVMCVTNTVATDITANALLACGAKPAMVEEPSEATELVSVADAVLINLGTVNATQLWVMRAAIDACEVHQVPWVLDPVACNQLKYRQGIALEFLRRNPTVVRGNHAEIDFLRNAHGKPTEKLTMLSTGEIDRIYFAGEEVERISGGVEMMSKVTATGCLQGAICAAYLGRGFTSLDAVRTTSTLMKRAGELAWKRAQTSGSFRTALIDALWEVNHD